METPKQNQVVTTTGNSEKKVLETLRESPRQYLTVIAPNSYEDVFNAPVVTIGKIDKDLGKTISRAIVAYLVSEVVEFFNVGKSMNDFQTATTVDLIIDSYSYFLIDDLKLCFKKALRGDYGKVYDRLDGAVILEWLRTYASERAQAAQLHESRNKLTDLNDGIFLGDYLGSLEQRAKSGDQEAAERLNAHSEIESFLKSNESKFRSYQRERERKQKYGK